MTRQWTPQQSTFLTAVAESTSSIALIAKAGSGKTTTVVEAATELHSAQPSLAILSLAFNVKIKKELEKRLPQKVTCLTLNGLGHRALLRFLGNKGVVVEQSKVGAIVSNLLKSVDGPDAQELWTPVVQLIGKAKTHGILPSGAPGYGKGIVPDELPEWERIASFYDLPFTTEIRDLAREGLLESVRQVFNGIIDFDDQTYIPVVYHCGFPQFDVIFVDEAQDLNDLQHIIVSKCKRVPTGRIVAVGDPNQAIYGFRGARHDSMDKLIADHKMQVLPLSVSFRCAKSIIRAAQQDVPEIEARPDAPQGKVHRVEAWDHTIFREGDAVACRNMAPIMACAYRLISKGIGVQVLGRDVGAGFKSLLKKLAGRSNISIQELEHRIESWAAKEAAECRAKKQIHKIDQVYDKAESILAVIDFAGVSAVSELELAIDALFGRNAGRVTFMTGHGSKGLEFERFFILDPWRLPSKFAIELGEESWQYQQEINLRYVMRTRAIAELVYINSDGWPSERGERLRQIQQDTCELGITETTKPPENLALSDLDISDLEL